MQHQGTIRLSVSVGVLLLTALLELVSPRRRLATPKLRRWLINLGMSALDTVAVRLLLPLGTIGAASLAASHRWGLLNAVHLPGALAFLSALLVLDLATWLQHATFHSVPLLWRLHMVHHTDLDLDASSGVRFHPLEILVSLTYRMAVVGLVGPSPGAVLAFEVLLNASSVFQHGNVRLPGPLDPLLRRVWVTPDMHRVHHSIRPFETNSNFGSNLSLWDRLLGTYDDEPTGGQEGMTIGLAQFRFARSLSLPRLMALPVTGSPGEYTINRREDRRLFRRTSWVGRLLVRSEAGTLAEGPGDMSCGGCLVLTDAAFQVGKRVRVELPDAGGLAVQGTVIRAERALSREPGLQAVAIEFLPLPPAEERTLSTLIDGLMLEPPLSPAPPADRLAQIEGAESGP